VFIRDESNIMAKELQTLSAAAAGNTWCISAIEGGACKQLSDMGFCEKLKVTKLSDGRNIICVTCGTKLVLNRELADKVLVSAL
jgi:ferrous iron transport protein A